MMTDNANNPSVTEGITNRRLKAKPVRQEKKIFKNVTKGLKTIDYEQHQIIIKLNRTWKGSFQNYERTGWEDTFRVAQVMQENIW